MFKVDKNDFYINGEKTLLISAEIHYFRLECDVWPKVLQRAKDIGCNAIAFYIPWFIHEYEEGQFDFSGKNNSKYNLIKFLNLSTQFGFKIIIRPGPYIYAEMTNLGLPNWLIENYKDDVICNYKNNELVKNEFAFAFAHNNPIFKEKVKNYIEKVIDVCKNYSNYIIMIQLCNEIPGLNVDDHCSYRNDFLQNYIKENYSLETFNRIFESDFNNYEEIEIKKIHSNKKYKYLHLEEQYSYYFVEYFSFLKEIYIQKGLNKTFIHNAYNPKAISLFPKIKEKHSDIIVGTDNYYSLFGSLNDKSISYFCEYGVSYIKNILNNIPCVFEHETGFWLDNPKVFGEELYIFTFWSLLYGYKGLNMYLFHEGVNDKLMGFNGTDHNWQALVKLDGEKSEKFDFVRNAFNDIANNKSALENVQYDCAISFEHFPGLIWDSLSKEAEKFYYLLFKCNLQPEVIDILKTPLDKLKKLKVIYFLVDEKLSSKMQNRLIELIKLNLPIVIVGNLPINNWYEKDCTLINYLNITIEVQSKDGFSQKIFLGDKEILYPCKNINKIRSDFEVHSKTNYGDNVILKRGNLIILNGFVNFEMLDQLLIIKYINESLNFYHENYGTSLRVIKKEDNSIFILNPYPFRICEKVVINNELLNCNVDGFSYKFVE